MEEIAVSVIAVRFLGIYGVLIGTIAALLYRSNDIILYASHHVLNRKALITYKRWCVNLAVFILVLFINKFINIELNSYLKIITFCIPYTVATLVLFFGMVSLVDRSTASFTLNLMKSKVFKTHK